MIKMNNDFLEIGKIVNTHALRGAMKMVVWADSTDVLDTLDCLYDENGTCYEIKSVSYPKDNAIIKLSGIDSIEQAEMFKGKILYVKRDAFNLPEGVYFVADLIGSKVYEDDRLLGKIDDVFPAGGCDVYSIKGDSHILFPALKENVVSVDIQNKVIKVRIPEGLLD
ncbi:MAG: 16S rRNA processing protein RimM [Ruminococcaceae bacterium]|nr:16S rRNA processing protein RimM [Oscillospiraceae bacterium]